MKVCLNKTGVALVLVLMIVIISAGLLTAIMYYTLSGTEISGLQRKYETSKEASLGAIDIFTKELIPRAITTGLSATAGELTQGSGIVNSIVASSTDDTCFGNKLRNLRANPSNPSSNWVGCASNATDARPTEKPDITFKLLSASGSSKPFVVQVKIIDTATGNSNMSGVVLEGSGVVGTGSGMITTRHFPYLYTITAQGQQGQPENNTTERANFEVLYAY